MRRWKIRFLAAVLTGAMVLGTPASALADVETLSDRNERYEEQERGTDLLSESGEKGKADREETAEKEEPKEDKKENNSQQEEKADEKSDPEEKDNEDRETESGVDKKDEETDSEPEEKIEEETKDSETDFELKDDKKDEEEISDSDIEEKEGEEVKKDETVVPDENVLDEILEFSEKTCAVQAGKSLDVSEFLDVPENYTLSDISWSSTNEKIAKVDRNGVITAIAAGSCKIKAEIKRGNLLAVMTLTVKKEDSRIQELIKRIEALPEAGEENFDEIDRAYEEIQALVDEISELSEEEQRKITNLTKLQELIEWMNSEIEITDEVDEQPFFVYQGNGTSYCTAASVAMMLRRRAYLDGNSSWQTITLNSVLGKFWVNGSGMTVRPATYSEPSYGLNMSIDCKAAGGYSIPDSQRIEYLSRYLEEHPEGIALWLKKDNSHMHSVIVTKEENGVFYCYDPAFTTGNLQRLSDVKNYQDFDTSRRLTQSELLNNYFFQFWYITASQNKSDVNNPKGALDNIQGQKGKVYVGGWAYDNDDFTNPIEVHVYIGGDSGNGEGHVIVADWPRADISPNYNHGYDAYIETNKTGDQDVYVYAINVGNGENTLIAHKIVHIPASLGEAVDLGKEFYAYVKHTYSERYLTVHNRNVTVDDKHDIWHFKKNADSSYTIEWGIYGVYLNAESSDAFNVNIVETRKTNEQKWYIYGNDGDYVLMPENSDCKVLDIQDNSSNKGANLQVFNYNLSTAQRFSIEKTADYKVKKISVRPEYVNLEVGKEYWLDIMVEPSTAFDSLSIYSSNPEVATINKYGCITAHKEGTTVITVAQDSVFATCYVTVGNGENVTLSTPTISKIVAIVSGTHIYWNKISDADSYTIYRANAQNGTYTKIASTTATHYIDTGVTSGNNYFYKVCANAGENKSKDSAEKGIAFVGTPDFTLRVNRSTGIGLGWNKISGATGYAVYRKSYNGNDSWVRVATITSGNTVSWTDTGVKSKNGSIYRYTVRALAGSDRKTLSGCRNTGRTMVRLMTPVLNSVSAASTTSMKAAWGKNSQASGYEVRLMVGGTVYKTYIVGGNANLTKTITGLKKGTTYKVQVRAYKKVDGVGSFYSAWSGAKNVVMK